MNFFFIKPEKSFCHVKVVVLLVSYLSIVNLHASD